MNKQILFQIEGPRSRNKNQNKKLYDDIKGLREPRQIIY